MDRKSPMNSIGVKIASSLYKQILAYIEYSKSCKTDVVVACLQEVIQYALNFCVRNNNSEIHKKLVSLRYILSINFMPDEVIFEVNHRGNTKESIPITYHKDFNKGDLREWYRAATPLDKKKRISKKSKYPHGDIKEWYHFLEEFVFIARDDISINSEAYYRFRRITERFGLEVNHINNTSDKMIIFEMFAFFLLDTPEELFGIDNKRMPSFLFLIELAALKFLNIHDVANGKNKISVKYDHIKDLFESTDELRPQILHLKD